MVTLIRTLTFSALSILHEVIEIRLKMQVHEGDKLILNSAALEYLTTFVDTDINALFDRS